MEVDPRRIDDVSCRAYRYHARFDARLEQRLAERRSELLTAMAGLCSDLVRWMFGFWFSTLLGIAGLLIALRCS